jgi:hypothetical protein
MTYAPSDMRKESSQHAPEYLRKMCNSTDIFTTKDTIEEDIEQLPQPFTNDILRNYCEEIIHCDSSNVSDHSTAVSSQENSQT